jgi:hypothetical protein
MRTSTLEFPLFNLLVDWDVVGEEAPIPTTPSHPGEPGCGGSIEISECTLWVEGERVLDLLDIDAVEEFDLWQIIEPKLWQEYAAEEK